MAQEQKGGGVVDNVRDALSKNPATERLFGELETFVRDKAADFVDSLGDRIGDTTDRLEEFAANGGMVKRAAKAAGEGDGPMKAGLKAVGGGLKDKIGDLVSGGSGGGDGGAKATVIGESIEVGVPVSVAYNQWTQFQEFGRFTKGVQGVEQEDDVKTNWKVKIFWSTRSWDAKITEQIPDERIAWTADGEKGSVNGAVTFHELAPNLTKVLLELEYHPKGLFEKTGNLWRAQGRRARLDLKQFRRFVMLRGEETGAWRGEIHDGEVTKSADQKGKAGSRREQGGSRREQGDARRERSDERRRSRDARRKERRQARSSSRRERDTSSTSADDKPKPDSTPRKSTPRTTRAPSSTPRKSAPRAKKSSAPAKKTTSQRSQAPARKTTTRKTTSGRKTASGRKSTAARKSTSGRKSTAARKR